MSSATYYRVLLQVNEQKHPELVQYLQQLDNRHGYIIDVLEEDMIRKMGGTGMVEGSLPLDKICNLSVEELKEKILEYEDYERFLPIGRSKGIQRTLMNLRAILTRKLVDGKDG